MHSPVVMGRLLVAYLLLLLSALAQAQFDTAPAEGGVIKRKHYVILAAENTALQKYLAGRENGKPDYVAHLLVDGQALLSDQEPNLNAIDWGQLKEDLQAVLRSRIIRNIRNPPQPTLMIHTYFTSDPEQNSDLINWTLDGFARQSAKFEVVSLVSSFSSGGDGLWERFDAIRGESEVLVDFTADESPRENEYVQVYPVRTLLSRLKTDNADCVVVIKPRFSEGFEGDLPRSVRTSMSVFSRQMEFDQKRRVLFSINFTQDGEKAKEWFLNEGAKEMQHLLGFRSWVVQIGH